MHPDNPFSSRFVAPDRHQFLFPAGQTVADLGERWLAHNCWGEIIGPHGTGKSTLLHTLCHWAEAKGLTTRFYFLNDQQRTLPPAWSSGLPPDFYALDGAEQLAPWTWWRLKWHCRQRHCGLLITAHSSLKLPLLYQTTPLDVETVHHILQTLIRSSSPATRPSPALIHHLVSQHKGDLRSILFELYDWWEERRGREIGD